jgi:hypothetical protein
MLFPFRTRSIFRSRWIALLWAAGIVWMAVDVAGSARQDASADNAADTDASGTPVGSAEMNQAVQLLERFGR